MTRERSEPAQNPTTMEGKKDRELFPSKEVPTTACSECGKTIEGIWNQFLEKHYFPRMCPECSKVQEERDREARQLEKDKSKVLRRVKESGLGTESQKRTFARIRKEYKESEGAYGVFVRRWVDSNTAALRVAASWEAETALYIEGEFGSGKSFLTDCICMRQLDKGRDVYKANTTSLLQELRIGFDLGNWQKPIQRCQKADVVVLDDLGLEYMRIRGGKEDRLSNYWEETLYSILESRISNGKRGMVFCTPIDLDKLRTVYIDAIVDRIYELIRKGNELAMIRMAPLNWRLMKYEKEGRDMIGKGNDE